MSCLSFLFSAPRLQRTLLFSSSSDRVAQMLSRRPGGRRVVSDAAADPVRHLPLAIGHKVLGAEWPLAIGHKVLGAETCSSRALSPWLAIAARRGVGSVYSRAVHGLAGLDTDLQVSVSRIERETLGSARLAVAHISPAALSAKAEGLGETNIHKRERRMKASKTRV